MKTAFNRFAILPKHCPDCHRYIWLEKYRCADVWRKDDQGYIKQNICSDCIKKYVGDLNNRKLVTDGKHTRLEQIRKMKAEEMAEWLHYIEFSRSKEDGIWLVTVTDPKTGQEISFPDEIENWVCFLKEQVKDKTI